jgi:hypothetical protein
MYLGYRYPLSFGLYRVSVTAHQIESTSVLGRRYTESFDRIEFRILKPSAFSRIASFLELFTPYPTPSIPDDRLSSLRLRNQRSPDALKLSASLRGRIVKSAEAAGWTRTDSPGLIEFHPGADPPIDIPTS